MNICGKISVLTADKPVFWIMTARLQSKIRKHAGIPNSASCSFAKQIVITNIKTVTGWTNKSTDAAAQTGGRESFSRNRYCRNIL